MQYLLTEQEYKSMTPAHEVLRIMERRDFLDACNEARCAAFNEIIKYLSPDARNLYSVVYEVNRDYSEIVAMQIMYGRSDASTEYKIILRDKMIELNDVIKQKLGDELYAKFHNQRHKNALTKIDFVMIENLRIPPTTRRGTRTVPQ